MTHNSPPDDLDSWDEAEQDEDGDEPQDTDFSDLEDLLAQATAATAEERRLKALRKRLVRVAGSKHPEADSERAQLLADIRRLEETRVWHTVGAVALFRHQLCGICQSEHRLFQGWMTEQRHASDRFARRLVAGKPIERMPERTEVHDDGAVEMCWNCAESVLAINIAAGMAPSGDSE